MIMASLRKRSLAGHIGDLEVPDEESMAYDSQSNAEAEISIQIVQGQIRTIKAQLEHRIGEKLGMDSPLLPWLVMHAGANLNRSSQGKDGYTAHRRLRGREFNRPITEFGECVWYYKPRKAQRGKIEPRWADGVVPRHQRRIRRNNHRNLGGSYQV